MKKRLLSMFLCLCLLLTMLPTTALAAVSDLLGNTDAENQSILQQLSSFTGGDSDEAYALLESLGLLDENGNLNTDQSILVDGEELTLAQVEAMLSGTDVDLTKIVTVGDTPISLGDLKTIIEIETELARIKETYFSDRAFTQEQLLSLNSLLAQIEDDGVALQNTADTYAHDARLKIGAAELVQSIIEGNVNFAINNPTITKTVTLTASGAIGTNASFQWRLKPGSIPEGFLSATLNDQVPGTFTLTPGTRTYTLSITFGISDTNLYSLPDFVNTTDQLAGLIEFYDPQNLLFQTNTGVDAQTLQLPIRFDFAAVSNAAYGGWSTQFSVPSHDTVCGTTPYWDFNLLNNTFGSQKLQRTAQEIYGADAPTWSIQAELGLYDTSIGNGCMYGSLPVAYDEGGKTNNGFTVSDYTWNTKALLDGSNPASQFQTEDGRFTPYIRISSSKPSEESQMDRVFFNVTSAHIPLGLSVRGNPSYGTNTESSDISLTAGTHAVLKNGTIFIYDKTAPTVKSVTVPAGEYSSGETVPILVEFSEPVYASSSKLQLKVNDDSNLISAASTGASRKHVFFYTVKDADNSQLTVQSVNGIEDLCRNETEADENGGNGWTTFPGVTLQSVQMKNAVTDMTVKKGTDTGTVDVALTVNQAAAYRGKYAGYDSSAAAGEEQKAPFAVRILNAATGVAVMQGAGKDVEWLPLTLEESGPDTIQINTATLRNLPAATVETAYVVEVKAYESKDDTTGTVLYTPVGSYTQPATVFANISGYTIDGAAPTDAAHQLSLAPGDDSVAHAPTLGVTFVTPPSDTTGTWTSSDTDIATIGSDGQVVLTGQKIGSVTFTFTANNSKLTDPDTSHKNSITTGSFTVVAGTSAALSVPENASTVLIRTGQPATVLWASNAKFFGAAQEFQYTVELFEGNYTAAELSGKTPTATYTTANDQNSLVIPADDLTALSTGAIPAYTVRISMPHPNITSETLSAVAYIVVQPVPAVVTLSKTISGETFTDGYLTDRQRVEISWSIAPFVDSATKGMLKIQRITGDTTAKTTAETVYTTSSLTATGSYTLQPSPVSDLKDTYMVTLRARNLESDGWSTDSFPLYVYNADALKLVDGDGQYIDTVTLDNTSKVSGTLPTNTEDIVALREELGLIEYVGINYQDHSWSQLKDVIRWSTSDDDVVSINYKQGSLYENIKLFGIDTYLPETKMLLSSVTDGTAAITATHANTGMAASTTVNVKTLRDKFYLFQISPAAVTTLTYTDGAGAAKTATTNADGYLALYEPNGISSQVSLKSTVDGNLYLGTLYPNGLHSGERDKTKLQLYPLNTMTLRQVAKVELYLKKADGTPFTGGVTLRGGVYKNGGYCQDARMSVKNASSLQSGQIGQTAAVGTDGRLTVYLDSTQFWSTENGETGASDTLTASDNIEYIFELTDLSGCRPALVHASGNLTVRNLMCSAGSTLSLESADGAAAPFIAFQTVEYDDSGNRINVSGANSYIGPNGTLKKAELSTTVLLWGEDAEQISGYKLQIVDEYGGIPTFQTSQAMKYPFSTIPVVSNTLTLTKETLSDSGWIPADKNSLGLKARLTKSSALLRELPVSVRVADLSKAEDVMTSKTVTDALVQVSDLAKDGIGKQSLTDDKNSDMITGTILNLLSDVNTGDSSSPFKMIITPTESNTTFKAMIWAGYDGVGMDDLDYSESGLALNYDYLNAETGFGVSVNDAVDMAKGDYDPQKAMEDAASKTKSTSLDVNVELTGYYEAEISYDVEQGKWVFYTTGGGFTAGAGVEYTINLNAMAGPVPLTASFKFGGALQLAFQSAVRYSEMGVGLEWQSGYDTVNDFLTSLRIHAYVNAFGGVGFDYSVVALKIGLFGSVDVEFESKFLSRTYLQNAALRQTDGQYLGLEGTVGIKFVAQFLFFSYEAVLVSGSAGYAWDWGADDIQSYWDQTGSGYQSSLQSLAGASGLSVATASTTLQSRAYLEEYSRSWGSESRALLFGAPKTGPDILQENANPASDPLITDDGAIRLYVSDGDSADIYNSRVHAGETIQNAAAIQLDAFTGYGDSNPSLAGTKEFAAAAWVRMGTEIPGKGSGDEITTAEANLLMNSTETVAAIYKDGTWTATRLTDNASPDLSPVVATNGTNAIVAWRGVYAANPENLTDFSAQDQILYKIYDKNGWSETKQLYNGTSGAVKGLQAAMLPDGTAGVTYTLDQNSTDGSFLDYEIAYAVVNSSGEPVQSMIATSDQWPDENPQITAVKFSDNDNRFVIGWYSTRDGGGDIRLLAVSEDGAISNTFPESISQTLSGGDVAISSNFRFADMTGELNTLDNLTLVWTEDEKAADGDTDHSVLKAVGIHKQGEDIFLTAAQTIAEMPARTLVDSFDSYLSGVNEVSALVQATWYDPKNNDTYLIDGNSVAVPKETVYLYAASGTMENSVEVTTIGVDYASLSRNAITPIQFTVRNAGIEQVPKVTITLNGTGYVFDNLTLAPNQSTILTCYPNTGNTITNMKYTVSATFTSGDKIESGTVYLDYPEIGVSQMETVAADQGKRTIRVTLYNTAAAKLAEHPDRSVQVGFYADDAQKDLQTVTCSASGVTVNNDGTLKISGEAALALIDAGAFTFDVTYDLGAYVKTTLQEDEIPKEGVRLYMNTWVEERDGSQTAEYATSNNQANVLFDSTLQFTGDVVTVGIAQSNDNGGTAAKISLRNNSLQPQSNGGSVIATLLDTNGNVLEQKQTSIQAGQMKGEETVTAAVNFSGTGSRVAVTYGTLSGNTSDSTLSSLNFEGLSVKLGDFVKSGDGTYVYSLSDVATDSTLVSFVAASASATVTVNGIASSGSTSVSIPYGSSAITVSVTAGDQTTDYVLTMQRAGGSAGESYSGSAYAIAIQPAEYGSVMASPRSANAGGTVTLTAKPDEGYRLGSLTVTNSAGQTIAIKETATNTYTFTMPSGNVTVRSVFVLTGGNPFVDVPVDCYYHDAVLWALEKGVTQGTSATTFSPDATCTRAQVVTFLWRAMGSPEPTSTVNPFTDVKTDAYYYKAVLWATEKGITVGTSATTFSPDATVTRAQTVTFLWRAAGKPAQTVANPFGDVASGAYYESAVLWAVAEEITSGTGAATFSPANGCTRAQIVTFLYRLMGK